MFFSYKKNYYFVTSNRTTTNRTLFKDNVQHYHYNFFKNFRTARNTAACNDTNEYLLFSWFFYLNEIFLTAIFFLNENTFFYKWKNILLRLPYTTGTYRKSPPSYRRTRSRRRYPRARPRSSISGRPSRNPAGRCYRLEPEKKSKTVRRWTKPLPKSMPGPATSSVSKSVLRNSSMSSDNARSEFKNTGTYVTIRAGWDRKAETYFPRTIGLAGSPRRSTGTRRASTRAPPSRPRPWS